MQLSAKYVDYKREKVIRTPLTEFSGSAYDICCLITIPFRDNDVFTVNKTNDVIY